MLLDQRGTRPRIGAARTRRDVTEAGHAGGREGQRETAEQDEACQERRRRATGHEQADPIPEPVAVVRARRSAGGPEDRPTEDRQQGRQQREACEQHQGDADGEGGPEALVEGELGKDQAQQRRDDREGGEADGLADATDRLDDGFVGCQPSPELLADAEHEEHAVVRAGAEDQHDQQQLRDRGDLDTDLRELGDDRSGEDQHECRRQERHERRKRRAEGEQQQHDDEQQREQRGRGLRGSRCGDRVDLGRQLAGQVDLETGWDAGPGERPANRVHDALRFGTAGERDDCRLDERLTCLYRPARRRGPRRPSPCRDRGSAARSCQGQRCPRPSTRRRARRRGSRRPGTRPGTAPPVPPPACSGYWPEGIRSSCPSPHH